MTRRIVDLNNNLGLSSPFSRQARRREMGPSRILLIAGQIGNQINSARRLSVPVVTTCLLTTNTFASFLRNTSLNPCGAGVTPTQCTCQNGAVPTPRGQSGQVFPRFLFQMLRTLGSRLGACGLFSGPPTCSCPNGSNFTAGISTIFRGLLG